MRLLKDWNGSFFPIMDFDDHELDFKFPGGQRVECSNSCSYVFNFDPYSDMDMMYECIMAIVRSCGLIEVEGYERVVSSWYGSFDYGSIPDGLYIDDAQSKASQGLYYWDYRKGQDKVYVLDADLKYGHAKYFSQLKGVFGDTAGFRSFPRGYTTYLMYNNLYVVVGGSWLSRTLGEKVCDAFGYNHQKYPWICLITPSYEIHYD